MGAWTSLPRQWKLEDVQAGLNVLITALSALVIFVFVRLSWQSGARRIVQMKAVHLSSILTLNTPGEVLDAFSVLRHKIPGHGPMLSQSIVIIIFSITTLTSGPIARYATRSTSMTTDLDVNGYLATRSHNSNSDEQVTWNLTLTSLDRAGYPTDELLDYLPETATHWLYRTEEWNNSWSLVCRSIDPTVVNITMTDDCSGFSAKIHGRETVIPGARYSDYVYNSHGDYYVNQTLYRDVLMFSYAANYTDYDNTTDIYQRVSMSLAALHMHNAPKNTTEGSSLSGSCTFGVGAVESSSFTRIDCDIVYNPDEGADTYVGAFPDMGDVDAVPSAYMQYYFSRFKQESISKEPISIITPRELRRFYQTYMIVKDVQDRTPVQRHLQVEVPVVQISTVFLVLYCLVGSLVLVGGAVYSVFLFRHRDIVSLLPQSKLDWIVQSITNGTPLHPSRPVWFVNSAPRVDLAAVSPSRRRRALFEAAWYSPMWPQEPQRQVVYPDQIVQSGVASPVRPGFESEDLKTATQN
ncbi:uncharacterized protein A1O9_01886 [Exophiala aquamarina CBS 119918]|uniref:Uncharacterized protein n=1 Tax=Exophiala aquamarina CBS 119918 TaxID=1182545 RepID=A0A072PKD7_9EURO|nr:uncharacterized protein A1O9_01886 [Exophiala aquamarina CBS 119918]KEF60326.1 hypothetical protein A1O9_01886 [Exophiala aquamarina CBS 119918]